MGRVPLVLAVVVVCACRAPAAFAQATPLPDGWVVLPIDEYRALRDRANPQPPVPVPPPVDATITRVDYELGVESGAVTGRAVLTIDVLRDGWTRVQTPPGVLVRHATLDGEPAALVDGPITHVLLSRSGRSILTLDIVVPLAASAGAEAITIPPSPAPISRVRLSLPKSGVDLTLSGGFVADRSDAGTESRWTAFGRPNQPMTIRWKRKADDRRAEQPLRIRARLMEVAALGEDTSQIAATIRVDVLQGVAREISIALPAGVVIDAVNSPSVADWAAADGRLRVTLLEPTTTEVSLVISGEARTAREGPIAIPLLRIPAAERETGGVAVDITGAGEVSSRQIRGLEPADPFELGDIVAGRETPSMIAFRLRAIAGSETRALTVGVVRYTPQAVAVANVEEARYRALTSEDGRLLVEARYAVRNNQRSFLKATLPAGSVVWSAQVGGRPIRPGAAETDAVLLPLEKGRANEEAPIFVVELVYLQPIEPWSGKGRAHIDLPAVDLPISITNVELHYSPRFRVEPQPGTFRVETDPRPPSAAFRLSTRAATTPERPPQRGAASGLQTLVDRFKNDAGGRSVIGALPVRVDVPAFGPAVFLASELTAEASTPGLDLLFRRVR